MITPDQLRTLAMALPEVDDKCSAERLVYEVRGKGIAWSWLDRASPKAPRKPRLDVLAVRRCQAPGALVKRYPDVAPSES